MLQSLTTVYLFLFLPVLLAAWAGWFVVPGRRWRALALIAAAWGAATLVPLVLFAQYGRWHSELGFERLTSEIELMSADLLGFFGPPAALANWASQTGLHAESWVFPGVTLPVVIAVSFLAWRRAEAREWPAGRVTLALSVVAATAAAVAEPLPGRSPARALLTASTSTSSTRPRNRPRRPRSTSWSTGSGSSRFSQSPLTKNRSTNGHRSFLYVSPLRVYVRARQPSASGPSMSRGACSEKRQTHRVRRARYGE